jgi:NADPH:quinone reductase-like Zn-dependent oxidoreductase
MIGGKPGVIMKVILHSTWSARATGKKIGIMSHKPNTTDLGTLGEMTEAGKLKPFIDTKFPLEETAKALQYFSEGTFTGKIVITVP